jgi:uncharacterized protein YfaT (DUF1175 family)
LDEIIWLLSVFRKQADEGVEFNEKHSRDFRNLISRLMHKRIKQGNKKVWRWQHIGLGLSQPRGRDNG